MLTVRDEDGVEQTLRVTEEHRFFVRLAGWTPAKSLKAGDTLLGADGTLTVVANEHQAHPQGVAVYNLEVEQAHTYFVLAAGANDASAVWVHNATKYDDPSLFSAGKHGNMPTPRPDHNSHHGAMSAWMKSRINGYDPDLAPAVLMPLGNHRRTFGVYNKWRAEQRAAMGGAFDWARVSESDMRRLSKQMFDAASVPPSIRAQYWNQYRKMMAKLSAD